MAEIVPRVSFIGLGRMGSAIAHRIIKAGFKLTVFNRTPAKTQPLIDQGASGASSARAAAATADVVLTSLMDDQSLLETVSGADGILAGLPAEAIHIGLTTVSPSCAARVAELHTQHGSQYVAGPVLGRPDAAEAGQLLTFVAGDPESIVRCTGVFQAYSQMQLNVGTDHRKANSLKLISNFAIASLVELMGQMYALAEKDGINLDTVNMLLDGMFAAPGLKDYATRIRARAFEPAGFELTAGLKDVLLILQAAGDARVALPYASVVRDKLLAALAHGMAHKDWSAIYEITRMNAGLP